MPSVLSSTEKNSDLFASKTLSDSQCTKIKVFFFLFHLDKNYIMLITNEMDLKH